MAAWFGYDNGIPTAAMAPWEFAPTRQDLLHWPLWGQYQETKGETGEPIDMPAAQRLMDLYDAWLSAADNAEQRAIWDEILAIHADQVFTIGSVAMVPQPVVVSNDLRNVPEDAVYNWDPGAHFGVHRPDTFWLDR